MLDRRLRSASQPCRQCTCPRADCPALRTPGRWTGPCSRSLGISARSGHFGHTVSRLVGLRLARPRPTATRTVRGNRLRWAAGAGRAVPGQAHETTSQSQPCRRRDRSNTPWPLLPSQLHGVYARATAAAVDQYLLPLAAGSRMTTCRGLFMQRRCSEPLIAAATCGKQAFLAAIAA